MLIGRSSRIDTSVWGLMAVLLFNAAVKWRFFTGLALADDFSYGVWAYSLFREGLPWDMTLDFRALRFALILPVAVLFAVFPPTEFFAVFYPMALSFGTVVLVYLIGREVAGAWTGVAAAFVFALFPGDVRFGTMLMPDTVVPFFLSLSVYAFLRGERASLARHAKLWYLLSGIAVFLAFNSRENSYYFVLFYLPFVFRRKRWNRGFWCTVLGFSAPVVLLYMFYWVKSGDFLYNLHLAEQSRDALIESGYIPDNRILWIANFYLMFPGLFYKMTGNPGFMDANFGVTFTLGVPLLIAATVYAVRKNNYRFLVIPWWFLIGYLFLEYGSISFTHYQMMKKLPRFLLIITPAVAIGCGYTASQVIHWCIKRRRVKNRAFLSYAVLAFVVAIGAGMLYVLVGVLGVNRENDAVQNSKFRWAAVDVLGNRPRLPVFTTGGWWNNKLSFFLLPDERFIDVSWRRSDALGDIGAVTNPAVLRGSYVIIDRSHFTGENSLGLLYEYDDYPGYVLAPPDDWENLGNRYSVEVYEVPTGWRYIEPDGRTLAIEAFRHALDVRDLMLAITVLHPDFLDGLTVNSFRSFIETMLDTGSPERRRLMETVTYSEYNGTWKLIFDYQAR